MTTGEVTSKHTNLSLAVSSQASSRAPPEITFGISASWNVNAKCKFRKFVESCAHICNRHKSTPIFNKTGTFQSWCSCEWLSIMSSFPQRFIDHRNHSITYSCLHSIVLRPFPYCFQCYTLQRRWRDPTTFVYISSFDLSSYN